MSVVWDTARSFHLHATSPLDDLRDGSGRDEDRERDEREHADAEEEFARDLHYVTSHHSTSCHIALLLETQRKSSPVTCVMMAVVIVIDIDVISIGLVIRGGGKEEEGDGRRAPRQRRRRAERPTAAKARHVLFAARAW